MCMCVSTCMHVYEYMFIMCAYHLKTLSGETLWSLCKRWQNACRLHLCIHVRVWCFLKGSLKPLLSSLSSCVPSRFSPFVKTGSEGYILGNVPNKVAIKHSDKIKIVISPESEFTSCMQCSYICTCMYMCIHVCTCSYWYMHVCLGVVQSGPFMHDSSRVRGNIKHACWHEPNSLHWWDDDQTV